MVAVRMHAAVLSAVAAVPLLSIHYASKGKSFMSDIGLADYTLAAEDVGCDILVRQFNQLIENYADIKSVLADNVRASSRSILQNVSRIRQLLDMEPFREEAVREFFGLIDQENHDRIGLEHVDREGALTSRGTRSD